MISVLTSLIAVSAFYGTWTGLDFMFKGSDEISPSHRGLNGAYCYVCILSLLAGNDQTCVFHIWHYRLWNFKLERFLHKNQHTQRKLLNFENWTNGEPQ